MKTLKAAFLSAVALLACLGAGLEGADAASLTRANNTTTYTANTGWNNATPSYFTFPVCPAFGQNVFITEIDISSNNNPALKLQGVLWLFNAAPTTIVADNANFNISATDFGNSIGGTNGIAFTLGSNQGSGAVNSGVTLSGGNLNAPLQVPCGANSNLYGMVEVVNAYVPAAQEVLTVNIRTWGY